MSLEPPVELQSNIADPGAHDLNESDDDHFSDASEGQKNLSAPPSPVPITRVERVDDEPSHGEVPGTAAYNLRTQDAVPDEVEVIPDGQRSRSTSRLSESDRPFTPGGTPVPKMIIERVDDKPAHGEVPGTAAFELRKADAEPDEVRKAPEETRSDLEGSPTAQNRSESPNQDQPEKLDAPHEHHEPPQQHDHTEPTQQEEYSNNNNSNQDDQDDDDDDEDDNKNNNKNNNNKNDDDDDDGFGDDGFGDDFDDFEQGAEPGHDDDDFGDFDDGFQEPEPIPEPTPPPPPQAPQDPIAHLPNINFVDIQTPQDILMTISPHLFEIFPELNVSTTDSTSDNHRPTTDPMPILTDRSASLWSQIVAPPPLQPPNWIRSRIRRLFLVSLGVPVDLDEILPASKQKKLILPNINLGPSTDSPRSSMARLRKEDGNSSSTSLGGDKSQKQSRKPSERPSKSPPPPPSFDANAASLLCSTTDTAMSGYTDEELGEHVNRLEQLIAQASEVLEYWLTRRDGAVGDKEVFEGVIENLVGFVKKNRDSRVFK